MPRPKMRPMSLRNALIANNILDGGQEVKLFYDAKANEFTSSEEDTYFRPKLRWIAIIEERDREFQETTAWGFYEAKTKAALAKRLGDALKFYADPAEGGDEGLVRLIYDRTSKLTHVHHQTYTVTVRIW